ncbi:MAG: TIGR03936 family radical SAM-associated protein [Clostridia bacterium]
MSGATKASSNFTIRFHFERTGRLRFTGHLDMLRTFQRAFMRAKTPIAYSQGFNPHPEFVIGMPLGVGTTSEAEYADLGMDTKVPIDSFVAALNAKLPDGLRVLSATYKNNKDNIMGKVDELKCLIRFEAPGDATQRLDALHRMLEKSEIFVEKTTKKGKSMIEIRSKIRDAQMVADDIVALRCDAGSHSSLSPELFVEALRQEMERVVGPLPKEYVTVHRTAISVEKDGKLWNPMDPEALK